MSARRAAQNAVVAGQHVDVEVRVHFERREHDAVEVVDHRARVEGVRVPRCVYLYVVRVGEHRLRDHRVEGLHVEDGAEKPLVVHRCHVAADAAEAEASDYAFLDHVFLEVGGHREARAADAHLEGEARPHDASRLHEAKGVLRDAEVDWVARDARRARRYLSRVSDAVRDYDLVDKILRNGDFRRKRILYEVVRNRYDVRRAARVRYRVAERAAGRRPLHAVDVAEAVASRGREEGHVYLNRALFYRARASAVAADDYRNVGLAA